MELAEQEGYSNITVDIEDMKEKYINNHSDFNIEKMLIRKYKLGSKKKHDILEKEGSDMSEVDYSENSLRNYLIESRRAEFVHVLSITPFWIWIIFSRVEVMLLMLIYALLANIPCIIIQRYNRPRIINYLNRKRLKK